MNLLLLISVSGVNDHAVFVSSKFFKSVPLWLVKHHTVDALIILSFNSMNILPPTS